MADWEDIRTFLAVARAGTLAAAGRVLDVDYTTVGRRVRALERELGLTLFERVRDRYVLTGAAEELRGAAERMEDGALALERRALGSDRTVSGVLRIATTDALAQILVLPAIRAMHGWTRSIGSSRYRFPRRATTYSAFWRMLKCTETG